MREIRSFYEDNPFFLIPYSEIDLGYNELHEFYEYFISCKYHEQG